MDDSEDRYELTTNVAHLLNEKSLDLKFEDFTGYQDYGHFETDNFFFAIYKPFEEILGVVDSKKEYVASFMSLIGQEDYSLKCLHRFTDPEYQEDFITIDVLWTSIA